ncbi:hypothetical protein [Cohaesibacter gelatinilyticus]|uniref:Uncharacterized protein n=1 Tax=Cohaesibacter gelatinilyticus TaxID=372072 RepID=A0A285PGU9_9HYPH|nr:hypothetical protein [Cohaesibacter gelatinilyticus]SNZ20945.1 hypothetical protein SAMN06265368_4059 [Cohaesibacter gelatinilyticus]
MNQTALGIQDLIAGLGTEAHWGNLEGLIDQFSHPSRKDASAEEQARREAERHKWLANLKSVFETEAGQHVLRQFVQTTLQRPSVTVSPETMHSLSSDQVAMISTYREGQNSIIRTILKDLAEAGYDPSNNKEKPNA